MNSRSVVILPRLEKILAQLGENLKRSRLRRKLTARQVAERAGITRTTLWQVEKGLLKLATDDELERRLQDAQLLTGKRAPKKK